MSFELILLDLTLLVLALLGAFALLPWRMLANPGLITPTLATLVILPPIWALPWMHHMPIHVQLSGACLVTLMLGWPLAVPVLCLVAALTLLWAPVDWQSQIDMALWLGVFPATLAMLMGAAIRRWLPHNLFVYIMARAFFGTVLCMFLVGVLAQLSGHQIADQVSFGLVLIARWLLAWGDAILTGMLTSIFVAFKPGWLATWSDQIYINKPTKR